MLIVLKYRLRSPFISACISSTLLEFIYGLFFTIGNVACLLCIVLLFVFAMFSHFRSALYVFDFIKSAFQILYTNHFFVFIF